MHQISFCQEYDVNFEADIPEDNSLLSEDLSFDGVDKKVRVPGWCQSARFIPYDKMSQIRPQLRYSVKCWREYRTAIKMRGTTKKPSLFRGEMSTTCLIVFRHTERNPA